MERLLWAEGERIRKAGGKAFLDEGGLGSRPGSRQGSTRGSPGARDEDGEERSRMGGDERVAGLREGDIGERLIPALQDHVDEQQAQQSAETLEQVSVRAYLGGLVDALPRRHEANLGGGDLSYAFHSLISERPSSSSPDHVTSA